MKRAFPVCLLFLTGLYPVSIVAQDYDQGAQTTNRRSEAQRVASENGYRDGMKDGRNDHKNGHSYRPTQLDDYKSADSGYASNLGDKDKYKIMYRRAFERGYDAGYNNGGNRPPH